MPEIDTSKHFKYLKADFPASIVVFFVALPLCLGIALASGAPLVSGLIAGIVGGIVVGTLSGSHTSVSGPAAGLAVVVLSSIEDLGSFEAFLSAVVVAGVFQIFFGLLKAGVVANFIPSSVIRGMLAGIGLILILKQLPHLVGYDKDYIGDEAFWQPDGYNTFSEFFNIIHQFSPGATIIGIVSLLFLILADSGFLKRLKIWKVMPPALIAVVLAILVSQWFSIFNPSLSITQEQLVNIPDWSDFSAFKFPDWNAFFRPAIYSVAIKLALIASIETLLSIEAADKLDSFKRITPPSRELVAQGVGNILSGLAGGLPMTAVIVRSSTNILAGARSKMSTILHGIFLLLSVIFISNVLNLIPLSVLAALLILVGYKLTKPSLYTQSFKAGWDQFLPFTITAASILITDLLTGVLIGFVVGLFFVLRTNFKRAITVTRDGEKYYIRLRDNVSFFTKPILRGTFERISEGAYVVIDGTSASFVDKDIIESVQEFQALAEEKGIRVEIKRNRTSLNAFFKSKD